MGRIRPCFTGLQGVQHRCRVARAIVGHCQFQRVFAQGRRQRDMHAGGVVACSVVQEIFHRAAQQGGIGVQHSLVSIGRQFHRHVAARRQRAFAELGGQAAQQGPGLHRLAAQRLCAVLQFAGQVQILDERPQLLALGADVPGLLPHGGGQRGVLFQLFGPAQNQRQRCAHIMADPGDPVRPRVVPPGNDFLAAAQLLTGAVDRVGQLARIAGGGQFHRAAVGNGVQPCRNGPQLPRPPPAEKDAAPHHSGQQHPQRRQQARCRSVHQDGTAVNVVLPDRAAGLRRHKQTVVRRPAEHRPIVEIPAGEGRDFRRCVAFI